MNIAAKHGHLLIVKYLIENGAQVNIANANGLNSLDLTNESIEIISIYYTQPFSSFNISA